MSDKCPTCGRPMPTATYQMSEEDKRINGIGVMLVAFVAFCFSYGLGAAFFLSIGISVVLGVGSGLALAWRQEKRWRLTHQIKPVRVIDV